MEFSASSYQPRVICNSIAHLAGGNIGSYFQEKLKDHQIIKNIIYSSLNILKL